MARQQWPPQPSQRLLRLLDTELPWTTTLAPYTPQQATIDPHAPDLDPALTQTRRLNPELLDEHLRTTLDRASRLHTQIRNAHQRHLNASWLQDRHRQRGVEPPTPDSGLDIND